MAGDETRRQIGDSARKLRDGARDRIDDMKHLMEDGADEVEAAVGAGKESLRRSAEELAGMRDRV